MADEQENLAFDELSKLSLSPSSENAAASSSGIDESSLKKENINIVFCGHVGKGF